MKHDVFEKLKDDHEKVKKLFSKIKSEKSEDGRLKLFKELKSELLAHAEAEEKVFYPVLEDEEKTRDEVLEAYVEHATAKALIEKMSSEDASTDEWMAMCRVLCELVEHHIEEEEDELFPKARKIIGREQAVDIEGMVEREEEEFRKTANF